MRNLLSVIVLSTLFRSCQKKHLDYDMVISNVNVLTITDEGMLHRQDVFIKADSIIAMTSSGYYPIDTNKTFIDGAGKYLLPGITFHKELELFSKAGLSNEEI